MIEELSVEEKAKRWDAVSEIMKQGTVNFIEMRDYTKTLESKLMKFEVLESLYLDREHYTLAAVGEAFIKVMEK